MARIAVLPESVANRIAAGEVVERPASALKELIENAIDAKARTIEVVLEGGGRDGIVVTDDGEGMAPDDILLALERHATSKIRTDGDIEEVRTLGFRGEAIPSIASVSRFRMTSRDGASEAATAVDVHGGRLMEVRQEPGPRGSRVEVMGLFYNAPARRKFLRSPQTERHKAIETVSRFAIGYPEVRFRLLADGRTVFEYAAVRDPIERCAQVLGGQLAARLLRVEAAEGEMQLSGLVSALAETRSHTRDQHVYVNRRPVRDRLLAHAVATAYAEVLPRGRYPLLVLLLDLPPARVDVNVHPSKSEVRFRHSGDVHRFVVSTLQQTLRRHGAFPTLGARPMLAASENGVSRPRDAVPVDPAARGRAWDPSAQEAQTSVAGPSEREPRRANEERPDLAPLESSADPFDRGAGGAGAGSRWAGLIGQSDAASAGETLTPRLPGTAGYTIAPGAVGAGADAARRGGRSGWTFSEGAPGAALAPGEPAALVPLGQFLDSYILARGSDSLLIVDQHVAHERVLFEKILRRSAGAAPGVQRLLAPLPIMLSAAASETWHRAAESLAEGGFEIEEFGPETILLRAVPAGFEGIEPERLLRDVLSDLAGEKPPTAPEERRRRVAATAACHAAIKVHFPLSLEKMAWLLGELGRCETPTTCPHGRPIVLRIGREEIERGFHRR